MNINERLIYEIKRLEKRIDEHYNDIDKRLTRMENGYEEQIKSINIQAEMISDLSAELSELQVKWQTRGEDI